MSDESAERGHAIGPAELGVLACAMHAAREAVQLHGGIGIAEVSYAERESADLTH